MTSVKYRSWMLLPATIALGASALVLSQNFSGDEAAAKPATKPNVIVIIADDLGYADISTYVKGRAPTPHIDSIARDGVLFTNAHVTAPICSPSRAGLMTGRMPTRFGFEYNVGEAGPSAPHVGLDVNEQTLGDAMQKAGYHTGIVGKWHLGGADQHYPTRRGFDEFYGIIAGATAYIDPTLPGVHTIGLPPYSPAVPKRTDFSQVFEGPDKKVVNNFDKYLTEEFADKAVDFIKRNKGAPFFLYTAFNAPHTPLQATQKYYDRFPDVKDEKLRIYFAMISALDDAVGKILKTLEDEGLDKNTLVVFMADNGCAGYMQGLCACEPMRGYKGTHYEGGVRVPFMMRWPAYLPKGKVYDKTVSLLDIFPTAVAIAGGALATDRIYDGVNLVPYLMGINKAAPNPELYWLRRPQASMIDGDWKLWESDDDKINFLFNLKDDPNEKNNLYSQKPEKVAELKAKMDKYRASVPQARWPSLPREAYNTCGVVMEMPR